MELKASDCIPNETWWILLLFVHEVACIASNTIKLLQDHGTLQCNQNHTLVYLVDKMSDKVVVFSRLLNSQYALIDVTTHSPPAMRSYAVACSTVCGFREEIGSFVKDHLSAMHEVSHRNLFWLSAFTVTDLMGTITEVFVQRTKDNQANLYGSPDFLSNQLVGILPFYFLSIVQLHWKYLEYICSAVQLRPLTAITRLCMIWSTTTPV